MRAAKTIVSLSFLFCAGSASAEDLCSGMRKVLIDAPNHFVNIRSGFDFDRDEYSGTIELGDFSHCIVDSDEEEASYKCQARSLGDTETELSALFERTDAELAKCFGGDLRKLHLTRSSYFWTYNYFPTDDTIWLTAFHSEARRTRSARWIAEIAVLVSEPNVTERP